MCKCSREHLCRSFTFSIAILNGTCFFWPDLDPSIAGATSVQTTLMLSHYNSLVSKNKCIMPMTSSLLVEVFSGLQNKNPSCMSSKWMYLTKTSNWEHEQTSVDSNVFWSGFCFLCSQKQKTDCDPPKMASWPSWGSQPTGWEPLLYSRTEWYLLFLICKNSVAGSESWKLLNLNK